MSKKIKSYRELVHTFFFVESVGKGICAMSSLDNYADISDELDPKFAKQVRKLLRK